MSEYAAKQVKKLMEEAINRPGMRAGLPKAKIPVDLLNSILKDRESLTSENTRLRALLEEIREEAGEYLFKVGRAGVMGKYDDEDMLYAGPGLLRSIFDRIPPSHKGED